MAITTYAELQTAMSNWLNRSDLTARIPEFIALAEPRIRRLLRDHRGSQAITLTAGVNAYTPGTTFKEVVSLRHNSSTRQWPLDQMTWTGLGSVARSGSGVPRAYTVVDGSIFFDVTPDSAYPLLMTYIEAMVPLATSPNTNFTFQKSPDIYLFGALCEAEPYLEHDERVQLWESKFAAAIQDENTARERAELAGTPTIALPVVFGDSC